MRTVRTVLAGGLALLAVAGLLAVARPAGAAPLDGATALSARSENSCTVVAGQQIRCWGHGTGGEIGDGIFEDALRARVVHAGPGPFVGATQVSVGARHACARTSDGHAWCWGQNDSGQLGIGNTTSWPRPVEVVNGLGNGPLTGVVQVSAGTDHTCARLTDGRLACWGSNAHGQLGDGTLTAHLRPNLVRDGSGIGPLVKVAQVASGHRHTCVRRTGQQVRCWGDNEYGQLGDGNTGVDRQLPVTVLRPDGDGPLTGVTQLATGGLHVCARLSTGQARCWGAGYEGQLGDGLGLPSPLAVVVELPNGAPLTGVAQVAPGSYEHTCFRMADGRVRCTGSDSAGQIGNPMVGDSTQSPILVRNATDTGPLGGIAQVAAGGSHTCARRTDGQVRCWGSNGSGQVGDGTTTTRQLPVPVQRD